MRAQRVAWATGLGVVGAVLLWSATAWACTSQASVEVNPTSGRPGDVVQVSGTNFTTGQPVEVRWRSRSGTVLARATGANFSVDVRVPDVGVGVYYIVAFEPTLQQSATASLQVTAKAPAKTGPGPVTGPTGSSPTDTSPADSSPSGPPASGTSEPSGGGSAAEGTTGSFPASSAQGGQSAVDQAPTPVASTGATGTSGETAAQAGGRAAAVATAARRTATAPPPAPLAGDERVGATVPSAPAIVDPSPRTVAGDLWSGLAEGPGPWSGLEPPPAGRAGPPVGAALMLGALAFMGIGFLGAELRRKRAPVRI